MLWQLGMGTACFPLRELGWRESLFSHGTASKEPISNNINDDEMLS